MLTAEAGATGQPDVRLEEKLEGRLEVILEVRLERSTGQSGRHTELA